MPDDELYRAYLAGDRAAGDTLLLRYGDALTAYLSARADLSAFSDADGLSPWARETMEWTVAVGVIKGETDPEANTVLDAQGVATRAWIAAIVRRFCEEVVR